MNTMEANPTIELIKKLEEGMKVLITDFESRTGLLVCDQDIQIQRNHISSEWMRRNEITRVHFKIKSKP